MIDVADVNEMHQVAGWSAYAAAHPIVIIRLHNGRRVDYAGPAQRRAAHLTPGIKAVGLYQYLVASIDAGQQAREFVAAVGQAVPGEFYIVDAEEGAGDQSGRVTQWLDVVGDAHLGAGQEWLYSGANFYGAHLKDVTGVHRWIASYGTSAWPQAAADLWQDTDAETFPGIGAPCDGSRYTGTLAQFMNLVGAPAGQVLPPAPPPATPAAPPIPEVNMQELTAMGQQHIFSVDLEGRLVHDWQDIGAAAWGGPEQLAAGLDQAQEIAVWCEASQLHIMGQLEGGARIHCWQDFAPPTGPKPAPWGSETRPALT